MEVVPDFWLGHPVSLIVFRVHPPGFPGFFAILEFVLEDLNKRKGRNPSMHAIVIPLY